MSELEPPMFFDHRCAPVGEYFANTMSYELPTSGPPPKSTVPKK
jgi:hypothetical protein